MKLFQKLTDAGGKLFNKLTSDPNLFHKIVENSRKGVHTIARVGGLASSIADHFGQHDLANQIQRGVNTANALNNNLEKAVNLDMHEINANNHNRLQYA